MSYAYANLVNPVHVTSGVAEFVLIASVNDAFETDGIKCPVAPFSAAGDEVTIKAAHEFVSGEGFIKVQLAPDKNKIDITGIGDKGSQKQQVKLTVFIPGMYAVIMEAVKNWLNKPHIVLIEDSECSDPQWYQLGCDCQAAWLTLKGMTGTTKDGAKGYEIEFEVNTESLWIYKPRTVAGSPAVTTFIDPKSQIKA